jgi:hypothetical protein
MDYRYFLQSLVITLLVALVGCDTVLLVDTEYYVSSIVNPSFTSNLVGFQDGNGNYWPGIGKDEGGTFGYARWKLTSISGQGGYTLSCDSTYNILDIKGGTSSSPNNPTPFMNNVIDSTLDGQSDWWMPGASKADLANLPNTDNGFWTPIINSAWNLALTVNNEVSVEVEAAVLSAEPASYNSNQYWFFASVTRGTVTSTATVTQVTTTTGDTVTQTFNADGPVSTITSTIINTLVSHFWALMSFRIPSPFPWTLLY